MGVIDLFLGFSGSFCRGKYWLTLVVWLLIWIVAILIFLVSGLAILGSNLRDGSLPSPEDLAAFLRLIRDYGILSLIILAFVIVSWISALAIGIKRLHDRDRSGWWIVVFYFGPAVLAAAQTSSDGALASLVLGLGAFAVSIWSLVQLGFLRGTSGHAATLEQVVKFAPKGRARSTHTPVADAREAIVATIQRAADLANENCDRAVRLAYKL